MPTKKSNGLPRDLLARRLLQLERKQGATNALIDVTNERLEYVARTVERLTDTMVTGFNQLNTQMTGLRGDVRDLAQAIDRGITRHHDRLDDLERRIGALEAKGGA